MNDQHISFECNCFHVLSIYLFLSTQHEKLKKKRERMKILWFYLALLVENLRVQRRPKEYRCSVDMSSAFSIRAAWFSSSTTQGKQTHAPTSALVTRADAVPVPITPFYRQSPYAQQLSRSDGMTQQTTKQHNSTPLPPAHVAFMNSAGGIFIRLHQRTSRTDAKIATESPD